MQNSEYWRERLKILEDSLLDDSYEFVKNLEHQFDLADKALEAEIAAWFQRFAKENEISLAEARKILTAGELAEFRWTVEDYIKRGESLDPNWRKQLENASIRVHISRLDSLKIQLRQHAEELMAKTLAAESRLHSVFSESYYHTAFEIQKGLGYGWSLQSIDKNYIDKLLAKPWTADEKTFRDRCWTSKNALVNSVNTQLTQTIMRGEPPDRAIKAISKEFNVAKNKAGRLVMTESAAFASAARQDCFNDLDVEEYVIIAALDGETCSLCGDLDGKHYRMSEYKVGTTAPPFHPWCRCTTAPYYDDWDELGVKRFRAAKDEEGKTYDVPADMTYNEWKKKAFTNSEEERYNKARKEINEKFAPFKVNEGLQNKHIRGSKNFDPHRSELTADPQELLDLYAGKSTPRFTNAGNWSGKEFFSHSSPIGIWKNEDGDEAPTNRGMIHYGKKGAHIIPAKPKEENE